MLSTIIECVDLDAEVAFFRHEVGCRIHLVSPADDPRRVVLHVPGGGSVELRRAATDRPASIAVESDASAPRRAVSPGGSTVARRAGGEDRSDASGASMAVPDNEPELVVVGAADGAFGVGRAGMEYRDLLPGRWGGRFIASHIRIDDGGDVDDWVHFHRIRFQMIYVAAGWVDVVYEDQGEPFRMVAGDCVVQPPEIRHRVLRSSPGLEVVEIGCPAEHDTVADHDLHLPTATTHPDRDFGGQRFVRHVAADAPTVPWVAPEMAARDTGIGAATSGLAGAVVVDVPDSAPAHTLTHDGEFVMIVGVHGSAEVEADGRPVRLDRGGAVAIPPGVRWSWASCEDHSALVVSLPADAVRLE